MGSKEQEFVVGYNYYLGAHIVHTLYPIDGIAEIWFADREAWFGSPAAGQIAFQNIGLFGGFEREGGVGGHIDVMHGAPGQVVNDYLLQVQNQGVYALGASVPNTENIGAAKGVFSTVWRRFYWGDNPYIKNMKVKLMNIYGTWDDEGLGQWESGTALIEPEYRLENSVVALILDKSGSMYGGRWESLVYGVTEIINAFPEDGTMSLLINVFNVGAPQTFERIPFGSGDRAAALEFLAGITIGNLTNYDSATAGLVTYMDTATDYFIGNTTTSDKVPAATGSQGRIELVNTGPVVNKVAVIVSDGVPTSGGYNQAEIDFIATGATVYAFGVDTTGILYLFDNTPRDGIPIIDNEAASFESFLSGPFLKWGDLNPIHMFRDALLAPNMDGYADGTEIGTSFALAAGVLYQEGLGMSYEWISDGDKNELREYIQKHIDGYFFRSHLTGKWEVKLIRDDYVVESLRTFGTGGIGITRWTRPPEKPNQYDLPSQITVEYTRREDGEKGAVTLTNIAAVQQVGAIKNRKISLLGFTTENAARFACRREVASQTNPLFTGAFECQYLPVDIELGSPIIVNDPDYKLSNIVARVTNIELGDGGLKDLPIIEWTQDSKRNTVSIAEEASEAPVTGSELATTPLPSTVHFFQEANYMEQVIARGQIAIDDELTVDPDMGNWQLGGNRPNAVHSNADIVRLDGSNWIRIGNTALAPTWTLLDELSSNPEDDQFTVAVNGYEYDIAQYDWIAVGTEYMRVDQIRVYTTTGTAVFTVGRGILDTVPVDHPAGTVVFGFDKFTGSDYSNYTAGETINARVLPKTTEGILPLASATTQSLTMDSRAIRPYPVRQLQLDGSYVPPAPASGTATLSWASSNRRTETALQVLDHTDAGSTAEAGTTYTLVRQVRDGEGTVIFEDESSLGTPSPLETTVDFSDATLLAYVVYNEGYKICFGIKTTRGGYDNWQTPFMCVPVDAPVAPTTDPFWEDVALLYEFDGTPGDTTFAKNQGYLLEAYLKQTTGTHIQLSNTQTKHYSTAASFPSGSPQRGLYTTYYYPDAHASLPLTDEAGSITVELWAYFNTLGFNNHVLTDNMTVSRTDDGIQWFVNFDGGIELYVCYSGGAELLHIVTAEGLVTTGSWHHIAIVRTGARDWDIYLNGTNVGSGTQIAGGAPADYGALPWLFGSFRNSGGHFDGFIDSYRVTRAARYTRNFLPTIFVNEGQPAHVPSSPPPAAHYLDFIFDSGVEGIILDPSAMHTLWQDYDKTIPVASDGDPVAVWEDYRDTGVEFRTVSMDHPPVWRAGGGTPYLEFKEPDNVIFSDVPEDLCFMYMFGEALNYTTGLNYHIKAEVTADPINTNNILLSFIQSNGFPTYTRHGFRTAAGSLWHHFNFLSTSAAHTLGEIDMFSFVENDRSTYINGVSAHSYASLAPANFDIVGVWLGGCTSTDTEFHYARGKNIYGVCIHDGNGLTADDITTIANWSPGA